MTFTMSKFAKVGAIALAATLTMAAPAFAHGGKEGKDSKGKSEQSNHSSHSNKPRKVKPVIDLTLVTVTPGQAAANAITAAGGVGQVTEIKLEAEKKGTRLQIEVLTPTGIVEVKLNLDGTVKKVSADDEDESHAPMMALPALDVPWTTYTATLPVDSSVIKVSFGHQTKTNTDVVKVEYRTLAGKKGKVRLNLDGSVIV